MKFKPILIACMGVLLTGQTAPVHAAGACGVGQTQALFNFTGGEQTSVVPAGVTSADIYIRGAQGGAGSGPSAGAGGLGGLVSGTRALTPGETLFVYVGGQGTVFNGSALGGSTNGGIGGGASDVRAGANLVANRIAVAGGGGGGGSTGCLDNGPSTTQGGAGGIGGSGAGVAGADSPNFNGGVAGGGAGGTLGVGGAAGIGCAGFLGTPGANIGTGGNGQTCCCPGNNRIPDGGGGGGGDVVGRRRWRRFRRNFRLWRQ